MVKSQKDLKGTKVFALECSVRNLKNFSKFTGTLARVLSQQTFVLMKTSWRRFSSLPSKDLLMKTNIFLLIYLQDVLVKANIFVLSIRLQGVFKTFSRCLQDVFKASSRHLAKKSSRRLQDVFNTISWRLQDVFKTFSRRFQDVFKMSPTCFQDVFKTS